MHRGARFILIQTTALALCLVLVCLLSSGLTRGEVVALRALEHLGKPYVFGAEGPDQFDCSGLVMYCLAPEGFTFPMHSAELIGTDENYPLITDPRLLMTGDVVCFDTIRDRDPSDHMGFYIGANQFVHASSTGQVMVSTLEDYYLERFTGARRYVQVYGDLPTEKQLREGVAAWDIPGWFAALPEKVAAWDIPGRLRALKERIFP